MNVAKVDFRREFKSLYTASRTPTLVEVPQLRFLMIDGHGDPNTSEQYSNAVSALFSVSYSIKFTLKRAGIIDYAVMPLEGLWWVPDMNQFTVEDKAAWHWTMMIMQPEPVDTEVLEAARGQVAAKATTPPEALAALRLATFDEGRAAQVLHVGPYGAEAPTIAALHDFIAAHGHEKVGKHHEIYLGDLRRAAPEKLKTILRQPVV